MDHGGFACEQKAPEERAPIFPVFVVAGVKDKVAVVVGVKDKVADAVETQAETEDANREPQTS